MADPRRVLTDEEIYESWLAAVQADGCDGTMALKHNIPNEVQEDLLRHVVTFARCVEAMVLSRIGMGSHTADEAKAGQLMHRVGGLRRSHDPAAGQPGWEASGDAGSCEPSSADEGRKAMSGVDVEGMVRAAEEAFDKYDGSAFTEAKVLRTISALAKALRESECHFRAHPVCKQLYGDWKTATERIAALERERDEARRELADTEKVRLDLCERMDKARTTIQQMARENTALREHIHPDGSGDCSGCGDSLAAIRAGKGERDGD